MKLTKSQLKQIIKDELSKKRVVHLEEDIKLFLKIIE